MNDYRFSIHCTHTPIFILGTQIWQIFELKFFIYLTICPNRTNLEQMFAELVINVAAGLENSFHYHVPTDLRQAVQLGHLVEVEFGRRLVQGLVIGFDDEAPVENTKPIISLIDEQPVLLPWQIELGKWMHQQYLAPLNRLPAPDAAAGLNPLVRYYG